MPSVSASKGYRAFGRLLSVFAANGSCCDGNRRGNIRVLQIGLSSREERVNQLSTNGYWNQLLTFRLLLMYNRRSITEKAANQYPVNGFGL